MTVKGHTLMNWKDFADQYGPDMALANFANVLEELAGLVGDVPWMGSNKILSHMTTVVEGLPTFARRRLNKGTASSKGTLGKQEDGATIIEGYSTVDELGLALYGNEVAARKQQSRLFAESAVQQFIADFIYGDLADDDEGMNGFFSRPSLSTLGDHCLDAGGTGSDLSSIVLMGWGEGKNYGIHPKNLPAGLRHEDLGKQLIQQDTTVGGTVLPCFVDQWTWAYGYVMEDPRYSCRIANIEPDEVIGVSGFQQLTDYTTNIVMLMSRAIEHIYNIEACNPVFYMPRAIKEGLKVQYLARTTNNVFRFDDVEGRKVMTYENIPIRALDGMTNAEAAVT